MRGGMREDGHEALATNADQGPGNGEGSEGRYAILQALHRRSELLHVGSPHEFDPSVEHMPSVLVTAASLDRA